MWAWWDELLGRVGVPRLLVVALAAFIAAYAAITGGGLNFLGIIVVGALLTFAWWPSLWVESEPTDDDDE